MESMKKPMAFLAAVVVLAVIFGLRPGGGSGALASAGSWSEALEQAKSEQKPILLIFGGPW